jgi:hypothetical protein
MDINIFEEVIAKAKCEYNIFKNFFYQGNCEYVIHNSLRLSEDSYLISGLGLYNSLHDFKIKLDLVTRSDEFDLYTISESMTAIIEFYKAKRNDGKEYLLPLYPTHVVIVKSVYDFYNQYSNYFDKIVSYFLIK